MSFTGRLRFVLMLGSALLAAACGDMTCDELCESRAEECGAVDEGRCRESCSTAEEVSACTAELDELVKCMNDAEDLCDPVDCDDGCYYNGVVTACASHCDGECSGEFESLRECHVGESGGEDLATLACDCSCHCGNDSETIDAPNVDECVSRCDASCSGHWSADFDCGWG